jgi:hypothetical protein
MKVLAQIQPSKPSLTRCNDLFWIKLKDFGMRVWQLVSLAAIHALGIFEKKPSIG